MKVHQGAYTFSLELDVPVLKDGKLSFALVDALPKSLSKDGLNDLKRLVDQNAEGVWAQSRLMVLLGLTAPEDSETTPSVLEVSVRASTDSDDEEEGINFGCFAGADGRTRVHFDEKVKKEEAKRISTAFWKMLLAEPNELDDYASETLDRTGAKVAYGVRDGRCFFGDPDDDVDIPAVAAGGGGRGAFDDFDPVGMVEDDDDWMRRSWNDDDDDEDEDDDDRGGGGFDFLSAADDGGSY